LRRVHESGTFNNCYSGNTWNTTICKDGKSCSSKCVVEGANYQGTYGATTSGNALSLQFITKGEYCKT